MRAKDVTRAICFSHSVSSLKLGYRSWSISNWLYAPVNHSSASHQSHHKAELPTRPTVSYLVHSLVKLSVCHIIGPQLLNYRRVNYSAFQFNESVSQSVNPFIRRKKKEETSRNKDLEMGNRKNDEYCIVRKEKDWKMTKQEECVKRRLVDFRNGPKKPQREKWKRVWLAMKKNAETGDDCWVRHEEEFRENYEAQKGPSFTLKGSEG